MLDYERLTVRDLKRIVNREEATPAAIGLFLLYDYWEREHGRRAIVDNKLLRYIEGKWQFTPYANELDFWLELGSQLTILELQAQRRGEIVRTSFLYTEMLIAQAAGAQVRAMINRLIETLEKVGIDNLDKLGRLTASEIRTLVEKEAHDYAGYNYLPSQEDIKAASTDLRSNMSYYRAYQVVMGEAGSLLGISLAELLTTKVVGGTKMAAEALNSESDLLTSVKPRASIVTSVDNTLSSFLTPHWRAWAQAGIKLRELADSSKGIVDLMQNAEIAAAEVENE